MLTPSAVAALRNGAEEAKEINGPDFRPRYPNVLLSYPIPLKSNGPALPGPQVALNWVTGMIRGPSMFFRSVVPDEPSSELTEDIRRKHLNTRAFAEHCERAPMETLLDFEA